MDLIRSNRKSIAIEIGCDLKIKVRAPQRMAQYKILKFVEEKEWWIQSHLEKMKQRIEREQEQDPVPQPTKEGTQRLTMMAKTIIPERVAYYAKSMRVTYGKITIRNQKTRWGSCSQAGNLNFNCHLVEMPQEVLDYVVVHELCHRKQMNHSRAFWNEVEKVLPDYNRYRLWLREYGSRYLTERQS